MSSYERTKQASQEKRPEQEQIDLIAIMDFFLKGFVRFWWLPIELALIVGCLFWIKGYRSYHPMYQTSAVYMVESNTEQYSSVYRNAITTAQIVESFSYILDSTSLKEMVLDDLNVSFMPATISVSSLANTNMMTLTAVGGDPVDAYRTLNAVVERFPDAAQRVVGAVSFKIVDVPVIPTAPLNSSNEMQQAKRGLLYGAFAGVVLLLVYALTRSTILDTGSIGRKTSLECIGELPKVRFKKRSKTETPKVLISERKVSYGYKESCRSIRTRLLNIFERTDAKVMLVTSTFPGEGKTTTAFNIALSLAHTGRSVVFVDGDLRKTSCLETYGLEGGQYDMVDVLNGRAKIEDALVRFENTHLKILSAKEAVENAAELVGSPRMEELIAKLRNMADCVIIDSPPVHMMTDALALANHADGILFIIRYDYGRASAVMKGIQTMAMSEKPMFGYIFNDLENSIVSTIYHYGNSGYSRYGYGRYGKYGRYSNYGRYGKYAAYGYGYGYGSEEKEKDTEEANHKDA